MTRARLAAAAAVLIGAWPAAARSRTLRVRLGPESARVVLPALFEPLLPGSVYPDRHRPRPLGGAPVAIVEKELARRAEPFLLERGFIVAEIATIDRQAVDGLLAELPRRIAGGVGEAKLMARRPGDALEDPNLRAAALFDPPPGAPPGELPVLLLRRIAPGEAPGPPSSAPERWYRASRDFPDEAFRDAAAWLASAGRPPAGGGARVR